MPRHRRLRAPSTPEPAPSVASRPASAPRTFTGPTAVVVLHQFEAGEDLYNPSSQVVMLPGRVVERELARGTVRLAPTERPARVPPLPPPPRVTRERVR